MNRTLRTAGMVLMLAVASAAGSPASAVNLLANPGFEDGGGSYTGWFTFGSGVQLSLPAGDNIIRTGAAASKVYGEFTGCPSAPQFSVGGYGQAFTPVAGQLYQFSGWSFVSAADPIPGTSTCNGNRLIAKIVFFNAPTGGAEISSSEIVIGDYRTIRNRWNPFTVSAPVPTGALRVEALILYLQPACDGGAVFVDDLLLEASTPAADPNLLANPHVNTNLNGWTVFGNVYYDARSWAVRTSYGSAKLFSTFTPESPSGMYQSFPTNAGSGWRFDLNVLTTCREDPITGTNDNYGMARIVFRDAGNNEIGSAEAVILDNTSPLGKWTSHVVMGTAPAGAVTAQCYVLFISPTLMGGAFWVDDLNFRTMDASGVSEAGPPAVRQFRNAPNPFSRSTRIDFDLARADRVRIDVYDLAGRRVTTLFEGDLAAGPHAVSWNGTTATGSRAAAGIYRCVMNTASGRRSTNLALVN